MSKKINAKGFFEILFELLTDTLCTVLITVGATVMINVLFSVRMTFLEILSYSLMVGVSIMLISRRMLITSCVLGAAGVIGAVYLAANKSFGTVFNSIMNFFKWWFIDGMSTSSERYFSSAFIISYFLVISIVTILVFLVIRKLKKAWILFIAVSIVLPIVTDLSSAAEGILGTVLIFLGFLPVIAKDFYTKRKLFSRKERVEPITPRSLVSLTAIILCLIVAFGVLFIMPQNVYNWRTRLCSDRVIDLQSRTGFYTKPIRELTSVSFVDAGLQVDESVLGGNLPVDNVGKTLATVKDNKSRLIKVATYEYFNGSKWNNYEKTDYYRINGPYSNNFNKYFSSKGYSLVNGESSVERLVPTKSVTITLNEPATSLYTFSQCTAFKELTPTKNPVIFNDRTELVNLFGIGEGYTYSVDFYDFPMTRDALSNNKNFEEYLYKLTGAEDEVYEDAEFYYRYTQLPKYWSNILDDESKRITEDSKNLYEAALKLADYFNTAGGYSFSKTPGELNRKYSLVDTLVASKKGYSIHYASAMCMMARNIGIPSRVVLGYKTVPGEIDGEWLIKDNEGYSWVECYFSRLGWVPFDAVPYEKIEINEGEGGEEPQHHIDEEVFLQPQIPEDDVVEETPEEPQKREFKFPYYLLVIPFIALLIYIRSKLSVGFYKYKRVLKRFKNTRLAAEYYYKDLLRQMKYLEVYYKKSSSLTEIYDLLPKDLIHEDTQKAFKIYNALHFGEYLPTNTDIELLYSVRVRFEDRLERKLHKLKYTLLRKILLPYFLYG